MITLMSDCVSVIRVLVFSYSNQQACIRWHDKISSFFTLGNGTRQGGVLAVTLFFFARYVRDLVAHTVSSRIGCNVGGMFINILVYADDSRGIMRVQAPSTKTTPKPRLFGFF